jgi:hypothetical protein
VGRNPLKPLTKDVISPPSRGDGRHGCGGAGRGGHSRGDPGAQQRGIVSQTDINKVTTVKNKHYPDEVYAKVSQAEKAKHWQLRNPGRERGTGPTSGKRSAANVSDLHAAISSAVLASISTLTDATTKRTAAEEKTNNDPDSWVNPNCNNPALVRRARSPKAKTDPLTIIYLLP